MSHEFSNLINQLNHLEMVPPNYVWSNIEAELQHKKKPVLFWFNKAQLATVISGFFVSGLLCTYLFSFISSDASPVHSSASNHNVVFTTPSKIEETATNYQQLASKNTSVSAVEPSRMVSNTTHSKSHLTYNRKSIKTVNKESLKETTNSKNIKSELIASIPTVESSDGGIKVYQNEEWISLVPIETQPIEKIHESNVESPMVKYVPLLAEDIPTPTKLDNDVRFNKGFYITPSLGANITQVYFNDPASNQFFSANTTFSGKFGYNAGFQLGYKFNSHWSIESGVFFSQNIQSFKEKNSNYEKRGLMYIDQLDFPLMARYSINFGESRYPKSISFKGGLMYNSILQYQVNYIQKDLHSFAEKAYNYDADKRLYNSLQLGYVGGIDFDAFLSKRLSLNTSILSTLVSQLENFPFYSGDNKRPIQFTTTISMGIKFHF